jgi:esterase/lipase
VKVPTLVINAEDDTGVYPSDAAQIYGAVGSTDKSLHSLPGDHYFASPDTARDQVADLIVEWANRYW